MKTGIIIGFAITACLASAGAFQCPVVDTGQVRCYDYRTEIEYPKSGQPFFG